MVQAGSVEALLTLNTSGFDTGISSAVKNIESLVKTLNSISTNAKGFVNGLNQVSKSMTMSGLILADAGGMTMLRLPLFDEILRKRMKDSAFWRAKTKSKRSIFLIISVPFTECVICPVPAILFEK